LYLFSIQYLPIIAKINKATLMKSIALLLVIILGAFQIENREFPQNQDHNTSTVFTNFCAGCHHNNRSSFKNRNWQFGSNLEDIFRSIKFGQPELGMPAFEEGFTDKEMYQLANYIIKLSEDEKLKTQGLDYRSKIHESEVLKFRVETIVSGLQSPWGLEFLPKGDLLITERSGSLYRFSRGKLSQPIKGLPPIKTGGQGGLLDIELHPNYEENGWIYISYSAFSEDKRNKGSNTAIVRAKLNGNTLTNQEVIFKGGPDINTSYHFGCRLEFDNEGYLFFSIGDRGNMNNAQNLSNDCGKIHRIKDDGSIPTDNPFVKFEGAMPSIYSYGHRNPQGLVLHPETKQIWSHEHGPKGGDEINIIRKGANYGWPEITHGVNYNGTIISPDTSKIGMEQPVIHWTPSIAPCGMTFVKGDRYPGWKNNILSGSLRFNHVNRSVTRGEKIIHQERLLEGIGRVRNVEVSPDGYIYVAIEFPGKILKLIPLEN
jgi:glucose/arabinose dehydrogenase